MNISAWSIRHPVPSIILFAILLMAGLYSFLTLGIDLDPSYVTPEVLVIVDQPGAAPSELEAQVTRRIEDAVASLPNLYAMTSTITEGTSTTDIEFDFGTSLDRLTNDVTNAVSLARPLLPPGISEPTIVRVTDTDDPFAAYVVASNTQTVDQLSWLVDDQITRAVQSAHGVGVIQRDGGTSREIRVELNPGALDARGLTVDDVNSQIRALNINRPGGEADVGGSVQTIRTLGSTDKVRALKSLPISLPGGGWSRLDSLGTVLDTSSEPTQRAFWNGQSVVAFEVRRVNGANVVDVAAGVDDALNTLRPHLPPGVTITKVYTTATQILDSYHDSMQTLLVGAVLAAVVTFLFLQDLRSALICAVAMPISVIPTFAAMKLAGFTLNSVTLVGLALVIGILVDDAIVEIENIVRHMHMGRPPYQASIEAADEIGLAVVATTMTIVVVFLPGAFSGGWFGLYLQPFGLTVAIAVLFSLLVARLLTPVMAAYWLKAPKHRETTTGPLERLYMKILPVALNHRGASVALSIAFFGVGIGLCFVIPTTLMGASDQAFTKVQANLAPGSTLDQSTRVARQLNDIVRPHKEVSGIFTVVAPTSCTLRVNLVPVSQRTVSQAQFEDLIRPELFPVPGVQTQVGGGGWGNDGPSVVLTSENSSALKMATRTLMDQMRALPSLADVHANAAVQQPEIEIVPNLVLAAEQGVNTDSIAHTAQIALLGDLEQDLARFDLPERQLNIRVALAPRYRKDIETIRSLKLAGTGGRLIPLSSVADVRMATGDTTITHQARLRCIQILSALRPGVAQGDATDQIHALDAYKNLPAGVAVQPSEADQIGATFMQGFLVALASSPLLIYAVLVLLFGDFMQPLTIVVSLPLSITGALLGLAVTGQALSFYALMGIMMLMGLVTKNAILLVEYCLVAMRKGLPRQEAVQQAGVARLRPILMTTFAMIAGMLPVAVTVGQRQPMAVAVIGGLITSTLLTLVVVPVVFTLVDDLEMFFVRTFSKGTEPRHARAAYSPVPIGTPQPQPAPAPLRQPGWKPWTQRRP